MSALSFINSLGNAFSSLNGIGGGINDTSTTSTSSALNDLASPFDFDLQSLTLVSPEKGGIDLTPYMVELNYFEDIFSDSISGKIVISDSIGIIRNLAVDGTERLIIKFSDGQNSAVISHQCRVFSITNRSFDIGNMFETYTINFCSEELLLSQKYRVCKSYAQETLSNIIEDVLGGSFLNTKKIINIDDTYGSYDITLPSKKVFETINWLTSFAQVSGTNGADMLFFENSNGYNVKSLQKLYGGTPYKSSYTYDPKNLNTTDDDSFENETFTILKMEVLNTLDTLKGTSVGSFASRLITFDPMLRKKYINDFNYKNYVQSAKTMNPEDITTIDDTGKTVEASDYTDRFGNAIYDLSNNAQQDGTDQTGTFGVGPLKLMITNSNQQSQQVIQNNSQYVSNDFFIEKTSTFREAQISLLNYTRVKIIVPGNSDLYVGMLLNMDIYGMDASAFDSNSTNRSQDTYLSGIYLITAIRHIINVNRYITVIELAKESNRKTDSA